MGQSANIARSWPSLVKMPFVPLAKGQSLMWAVGPPCFSLLLNDGDIRQTLVLQALCELWRLRSLFFVKITLILAK
jgi:hypothetical protein